MSAPRFERIAVGLWIFALILLPGICSAATAGAADCAEQSAPFDGTHPLHYADVIAEPSAHAHLLTRFPARCSQPSNCESPATLAPGDTVAVAKTCGAWAYVQLIGKEHVSTGWLAAKLLQERHTILPFDSGERAERQGWSPPQTIRVRLVKGRGVPVCEAYLQRLNQTEFRHPAYCGIPENSQVPGFAYLNRTTLKAVAINQLFVQAHDVLHFYRDRILPPPAGEEAKLIGQDWVGNLFERVTESDDIAAWGYEPRVDIRNNGRPARVVIWSGFPPVWPHSSPSCGTSSGQGEEFVDDNVPFILTDSDDAVDVDQTIQVFGMADLPARGPKYIPLGLTTDVFVYHGATYFSTFEEATSSVTAGGLDQVQGGHLSVYFNQAGVSQQLCRYQSESKDHWGTL